MKKAIIFALAVCMFSWAVFGAIYLISGGDIQNHKLVFKAVESLYMLFPMIVAGVLQLIRKEPFKSTGLLNFKIGWSYLSALVIPLAAVIICTFISALLPGVKLHFGAEQLISQFGYDETTAAAATAQLSAIPPVLFILVEVISGLIAGCTINALFAFGEEYGWRNYMVSALRNEGFWAKALFIGFVWGIWHMPLILLGHNYPQHPVPGVGLMCVFCILAGTIELYLVLKSGSVFPAAIFHGTLNALAGLVLMLVEGGNDLTIGLTGVAGFITLLLIIAAIAYYDKHISQDGIMCCRK